MKRLVHVVLVLSVGVGIGSLASSSKDTILPQALAQDGDTVTKTEQNRREKILATAMGGGLVMACYGVHQDLGGLAHGLINKTLKIEDVQRQAGVYMRMLKSFEGQLNSTTKIMPPEAAKSMAPLINLVTETAQLATALEAYTKDQSAAKAKAFTDKQTATWNEFAQRIGFPPGAAKQLKPRGGGLAGK
jgi:hypothetical protein